MDWGLKLALESNIYQHPGSAGQFPPPLQGGGGGGTFDGMEVIDAKIAAAEARTDAKFAEMIGELKALRTDLHHMPSTTAMIGTMGGFTALAISILLAVSALSGQMFGIGMDAQQVSDRAVQSAAQRVQPQIDALASSNRDLDRKIDDLIRAIQEPKMRGNGGDVPAPYVDPSK